MTSTFLIYPRCDHSLERKNYCINNQKTRLFCKLPFISESILKYESQGYYIIGIIVDDDSSIVELLYSPALSNPEPLDHIHAGLNGYIDEEIPRTYPHED